MGQACETSNKSSEILEFSDIQTSKLNSEVHYKDRHFIIPLPQLPSNKTQRSNILSKWLHEVVGNSMSVAFNYRREEKMDKQATTVFACQNIIRNLIEMSYNSKVTQFDLAQLDEIFSKKILPSIKVKYPMSQQKQNNLTLMKQFDVIDNFDTKENDYIISSKVIFEYRTNGKYEDIIMNFLNELIQLPNQRVKRIRFGSKDKLGSQKSSEQLTLYQYFEEFMRYLFESVQDYDKINEGKSAQVNETFKNKYRQEVKSYTSYQIGRKIPADAAKFDDQAIRAQQIKVKNSGVMRIMTKWAEELSKKFQDKYYFINLVENPVLINKKESFAFSLIKKQKIQGKIGDENVIIQTKIKKIKTKNLQLQAQILNDTKNNAISYVPNIQLQEVYFAGRTLSVLQVNLSKYLNRLIHGLADVSRRVCFEFKMNPPILLFTTFKIGDLIRCKCKSKEKQIVHIYKELKKISKQNPKFLKIIRVKNRLEQGTKDVLINVRFYEKITAEIQLAIRSESKKYTEDSTEINHTLYELERAIFGPISQLCSIVYNLNKDQSKTMQKAIDQSFIKRSKQFFSLKTICFHIFRPQTEPFLCSSCFKLITSNENIVSNQECNHCHYRECSNCRLKSLSQKELKQIVFEKETLIQNSKQYYPEKEEFAQLKQGIALYKFSKRRIVTAFRYHVVNMTDTLVTCRESSDPIVHPQTWTQFCSQYLIWRNDDVPNQMFQNCNQFTIIQKCYISDVFKKYRQKQRKKVSLEKCNMTDEFFQDKAFTFWTQQYCPKIQTLSLQSNKLTNLKSILQIAPNLAELTVDDNSITQISFPDWMKTLRSLSLKRNKSLEKIDRKIKHPESLEKLIFGWNLIFLTDTPDLIQKKRDFFNSGIRSTLPKHIEIFKNLKELHVLYNGVRQLPDQFTHLKNLKFINLEGNFFEQFPPQIFKIKDLDKIAIGDNFIKRIPPEIAKLKKLRVLLIPKNLITEIPEQFQALYRLETLGAEQNKISSYPHTLHHLASLIRMKLNNNGLSEINHFQNKYISEFYANDNQLDQIPHDLSKRMQNVVILQMSGNPFKVIPPTIWQFEKLQKLLLNNCQLVNFPYPDKKFPSLKVLQLQRNYLTEVSPDIMQFPNLEQLCIDKNKISFIPNDMKHLKKLNYLTLSLVNPTQSTLKVYKILSEYSWLTILPEFSKLFAQA